MKLTANRRISWPRVAMEMIFVLVFVGLEFRRNPGNWGRLAVVAIALMLIGILVELGGKPKRPRHKAQASAFRVARLLGRRWRCEGCFQDNSFTVTRCPGCDRIAPGAGWSCAVCETENSLSDTLCRECSVPRPEEDFQ